jgi:23S rRNA pseudouridine1911/1915/1917 synthase
VDAVIRRLYEDNHILVVVKPVGIPVQADASGGDDLLSLLKADIKVRYQKPGAVYLGLVHRLDQPVGGVMVFARTSKAAGRLSAALRDGKIKKRYLCVTQADAPGGILADYLLKDTRTYSSRVVPEGTPGAKLARLRYEPLARERGLTLCRVALYTGRSHQIRVQLSHSGYPIWGDARYNPQARPGQDIALFCQSLSFPHPVGGQPVTFSALPSGSPWTFFDPGRLSGLKEDIDD